VPQEPPSGLPAVVPGEGDARPAAHGWAGWVVFAGVMLILVGFFHAIEGLVALFQDDYYTVRPSGLVVSVNYTVWGWVHLVLGIVALLTGMGLLAGNLVARVVGVGLAVVSAIVNLAFVAAFPVAATLLIVFDVVIIYAIVVHGGELKRRTR
jgi:uncharacterized membrane protein